MNPRPSILQISPYIGGDAHLPGEEKTYRMASNESALGASPNAIQAYLACARELHRYPDGSAKDFRSAIGAFFGIHPDRVVGGTGSDELIHLLVQAYASAGDEILYSRHGFLVYRIAALINGAIPVEIPENNLRIDPQTILRHVTKRTRIVFLANPNNPTGFYLTKTELRALCEGLPKDLLLVIDAAYAEYADQPDYESGLDLVNEFPNVVMLRTFSKIYGLASLRVGWAYCSAEIADILNRIRGPFNLSTPAQAAAIAALHDHEHTEKAKAHNDYWRGWFIKRIHEIGLTAYPSLGNFVLVKFPAIPELNADRGAEFLNKNRILPRKMGAYHLSGCLRFTIAEEDAVEAAAQVLQKFMQGLASQ